LRNTPAIGQNGHAGGVPKKKCRFFNRNYPSLMWYLTDYAAGSYLPGKWPLIY
jgi:hypothetical protein